MSDVEMLLLIAQLDKDAREKLWRENAERPQLPLPEPR